MTTERALQHQKLYHDISDWEQNCGSPPIESEMDELIGIVKAALTPAPVPDLEFDFHALFTALDAAISAPQAAAEPLDDMMNKCHVFIKEYRSVIATTGHLNNTVAGWRDIATAPKDGTMILVASTFSKLGQPDKVNTVANARWVESNHEPYEEFWHDIEGQMGQEDVELWCPMPLPAAPDKTEGGK